MKALSIKGEVLYLYRLQNSQTLSNSEETQFEGKEDGSNSWKIMIA